uniref:Transcription factor CBF/NF-Y/archaeal histone domain-containing protein n=1 Tax=Oryza meridionalis TaxID=40149 RepID=A0A0E0EE52_9ORYZ
MPDSDNESGGPSNAGEYASAREQDRFLPIANVSRIMKRALPANAKISKDAKETVQECVSEFISFITGEASDKCQREKRKTINGDDLLWAMTTLGFEDYIDPLKLYLHKFRELEGEKAIGAAGSGGGSAGAASSGGSGSQHHQDASRNNGGYGMYGGGGGGMIMMMGQPMYGSPPASAGYAQPPPPHHHHHHQMVMGGKSGYGHGGGGGGGPSPSSGYGRQDRL